MELKQSIINLNVFLFIFISCFDSHQINRDKRLKSSTEYNIDKKLIKIETFNFEYSKLNNTVDELCDSVFFYKKFNLLNEIELVRLNDDFSQPNCYFNKDFTFIVPNFQRINLTNGESFNYFKTAYLYNLKTKVAIQVYNQWIEGTKIDFMMLEKFIILRKVINPNYDYVSNSISNEEINNVKEYSYLVIRLNDFSIVDDVSSQDILKEYNMK